MEEDSFILVHRDDGCQGDVSSNVSQNLLSEIDSCIERFHTSLWPLNKFIHENPELAFKEYKAHEILTNFIRLRKGWQVTTSAYGMETAWVAVYDSGNPGPVVSFNIEMDALPKLGHACGHNLIATASLAAGLATAEMIRQHDLPGKVFLFGTPGEEGIGGGKIRLLEAGAYEGVDISLISHPGILHNSPLVRTTAFARLEIEYFGRAAHAANSPWLGVNALDALIIAYNAISVLRQQTMPSDVIGMQITNGGAAPNIIHSYAAGVCVIRAISASRLKELQQKVSACFRAGAEATGAREEVKIVQGYADHVPNRVLAASYTKYWNLLPDLPDPPIPSRDQFTWVNASTDQGNISYAMPSVNASFAITPGPQMGQPHSPDFEGASGTKGAFVRALRVGKALAGTAVDVLSIPGLINEVKGQWRRDMNAIEDGYTYCRVRATPTRYSCDLVSRELNSSSKLRTITNPNNPAHPNSGSLVSTFA
ncbi:putative amidohydrolase [Amniculicola lignicola CBS 123094]|uniref:Putative amidohydrolase n=1 Tax=Amniculicola lignicola CBS 123094 TaxID=1392246 RepID=A0A6A5VVV0_9PLEO|nr:putative amidohydrolase [Amniculicola lignicola CBS 123094]